MASPVLQESWLWISRSELVEQNYRHSLHVSPRPLFLFGSSRLDGESNLPRPLLLPEHLSFAPYRSIFFRDQPAPPQSSQNKGMSAIRLQISQYC